MPSIFTLEGVQKNRKVNRMKRSKKGLGEGNPPIGSCKCVRGKGGSFRKLCYVGKTKSRSGWQFTKGPCK